MRMMRRSYGYTTVRTPLVSERRSGTKDRMCARDPRTPGVKKEPDEPKEQRKACKDGTCSCGDFDDMGYCVDEYGMPIEPPATKSETSESESSETSESTSDDDSSTEPE